MIVIGESLVDLVQEDDGRFDPRLGGSARNIAIALARLGVDVTYAGGLGDDDFADALRADFEAESVGLELAPRAAAPTPLAVVTVDDDGVPSYSFHLSGTAATVLDDDALAALPDDAAVHVSLGAVTLATDGVGERLREVLRRRATAAGLTTLDPNVRPAFLGDPADQRALLADVAGACAVLRCSDEDLELLAGDGGVAPADVVASWLEAGASAVVVTRGGEGAEVTTATLTARVDAPRASVVDTVGAGDTFGAGMLTALLERGITDRAGVEDLGDEGWHAVLGFAAAAAAVTVARRGADPPRRDELAAVA